MKEALWRAALPNSWRWMRLGMTVFVLSLVAANPVSAEDRSLYYRGITALKNDFARGTDDAVDLFTRYIDTSGSNPTFLEDAYLKRGQAHARKGRYAAAVADFDRALRIDPDDTYTLKARADTYLSMGKRVDAVRDWNRLLELTPNDKAIVMQRDIAISRMSAGELAVLGITRGEGRSQPPVRAVDRRLVKEIQRLLTVLGYQPGPVDGLMGRRTRTAIEAFQRAEALERNGQPSAQLRDRLEARVAESPTPPQQQAKNPPDEADDLGDLSDLEKF